MSLVTQNIESNNEVEITVEINSYLENYKLSNNEASFTPDKIYRHYNNVVDFIVWENKECYYILKIREGQRVLFYSTKYFDNINFQEIKNLDPNLNYILEKDSLGITSIKTM